MLNHLVFLFALVSVSFSTKGQSPLEKEISVAVEVLRLAMIDGEKATLEKTTSDYLSYGHSNGRVENKSEFIENIASGKSDFITMNLSEQVITITNEKVALVRHMLDADILDGGNPNTIKLKVLLVFQKDKAGWILIARQAVKVTP